MNRIKQFIAGGASGPVVGNWVNPQPVLLSPEECDFRDFFDRTILSQVFGITPIRKK